MKLIRTQTGGYPRTMDPVLSMQAEMIAGMNASFANLGKDMVLQGCVLTNNGNGTVNIAAGIMYVSAQVLRFDGAQNIPADGSKAIVVGSAVDSNPLVFGNQSTYNLYTEQKAIIVPQDPNNFVQMKVGTSLYSLQQYMADQVNASVTAQINASVSNLINGALQSVVNATFPKGSIREVYDMDGTFLQNFDSSGKGIAAPWINWAIDNGNNGTKDSQGRATIGAGSYTESGSTSTYTSGQKLGEANHLLTINEMPQHAHTLSGINTGGSFQTAVNSYQNGLLNTGTTNTLPSGGSTPHNNLPPSIAVYRVVKIS